MLCRAGYGACNHVLPKFEAVVNRGGVRRSVSGGGCHGGGGGDRSVEERREWMMCLIG